MKKGALLIALVSFFLVLPAQADNCRRLVELYNKATESRDFREKETLFKEALTLGCVEKKYVARVYNNLGDAYENAGRLREAIAEYKKAIEVDPIFATPYFGLGDVYSKMKDYKWASHYYEQYRKMAGLKTQKKALLVGIDTYKNLPYFSRLHGRRFENLRGAVDDVRIMKEALKAHFDFNEENIKILTNGEATREGILRAFEDWLIKGTKEEDLTLFYFSGHGTQVPDTNGDEDDGLDEALCAFDTVFGGSIDPEKAKIIIDDELGEMLQRIKAKDSVVIIDTCNSGTATRSINGVPVAQLEETPFVQAKFVPLDSKESPIPSPRVAEADRKSVDYPAGHLFISASREDQYAYEVTAGGRSHGALTRALVEGMRALKDPSYRDLYEYAKKVVKDRYKLNQDPQLEPEKGELPQRQAFQSASQVLAQSRSEARKLQIAQTTPPRPEAEPPGKLPILSDSVTSQQGEASSPVPPPVTLQLNTGPRRPEPPAEIQGHRVAVKVENIEGGSEALTNALKKGLGRFSFVEISEGDQCDRFIRGEVKGGEYHLRLVNRVGDVVKISPAKGLEAALYEMAPHLEYACIVKRLAHISHPSPPFKVSISVPGDRRDFRLGETIRYEVASEEDCYLLVLNLDSHGNFRMIFPNPHQKENFVHAKTKIQIPDQQRAHQGFEFKFTPPAGEETVKVIATNTPIDLNRLGLEGFEKTFKEVSGNPTKEVSGSRTLTTNIFTLIAEKCRDQQFRWSEDTIVLRSH